jgi:mannosyltransferase OCH1-like enzyme
MNEQIPINIFQTWHSKILPPSMRESSNAIKELNPEFNYYLFDDNDCRLFLQSNYDKDVLDAYDNLIPGAYKADLWRYCVLYKFGGVYLDIKYIPIDNFKLLDLINEEHFCNDLPNPKRAGPYKQGIYNAFMVCKPGNQILKHCINKCVENCQNKFYGNSALEITGPTMMVQFFDNNELKKCEDLYHTYHEGLYLIIYNKKPIMKIHPNYRKEQSDKRYQKNGYISYTQLWFKRQVFSNSEFS